MSGALWVCTVYRRKVTWVTVTILPLSSLSNTPMHRRPCHRPSGSSWAPHIWAYLRTLGSVSTLEDCWVVIFPTGLSLLSFLSCVCGPGDQLCRTGAGFPSRSDKDNRSRGPLHSFSFVELSSPWLAGAAGPKCVNNAHRSSFLLRCELWVR